MIRTLIYFYCFYRISYPIVKDVPSKPGGYSLNLTYHRAIESVYSGLFITSKPEIIDNMDVTD